VGNRAFGRRFHHLAGVAEHKAASALLLLLPYTPMLFMGQEFAASSRFYYFTDHPAELGRAVTEGRRQEFASFAPFDGEERQSLLPDPQDIETFLATKLKLEERDEGVGKQVWALYCALIALRRSDPVLRRQDRRNMKAVAASNQVLLVHLWDGGEQRLIAANFGVAIDAPPVAAGVPDDLAEVRWQQVLSTEERRFGGTDDVVRLGPRLVSLPPYTVAWLTGTRPSLPARLASRVRRAASRARRRQPGVIDTPAG